MHMYQYIFIYSYVSIFIAFPFYIMLQHSKRSKNDSSLTSFTLQLFYENWQNNYMQLVF